MKKARLINILLVVFSVGIMLIIGEFTLRALIFSKSETFDFLRKPSDYAIYIKDPNEDLYNEDYWKLQYLLHATYKLENPHPLLGWAGSFDHETLNHWNRDKSEGKIPVLLFGDSFAFCVDSVECFEDIMNRDTSFSKNHCLLNYGVGGYGIDQIYLLLKESLPKYANPIVILGMLTTDLDRSMLKVRDAQKPYFEIEGNELELKGTPITQTSDQYFAANPPEITSYLWNKAYVSIANRLDQCDDAYQARIEEVKKLNGFILKRAFDELKSSNIPTIVLIFKPTWQKDDWRLEFLKETCELNGMRYIVNDDLIKMDMKKGGKEDSAYFLYGDGHPNSAGNKVVSTELLKLVLELN